MKVGFRRVWFEVARVDLNALLGRVGPLPAFSRQAVPHAVPLHLRVELALEDYPSLGFTTTASRFLPRTTLSRLDFA